MIYKVEFLETALKEWEKLNPSIRTMFAKKLKKLQENPKIPKNKLHLMKDCYKIKLKTSGYRLVYKVIDDLVIIQVIAIGEREKNEIYNKAKNRNY
ncbi:type II toxin-antitoxin system RelE/ParE family toxin [Tatumella sp. JGM130]|uniref:type II toxin-antitoxin system RelE family toxin n=1 Tax=Tatumella sp. JGM130 TaxID=2799797 RepID=UPI001BAFB1B3|nr:type II toxin-antitoxin system RelE/ParE family toxin [Tatumella sp. JGM130]MBS0895209.1 type II toxin-antitoxin system RelE/ParE family toxin [Tatumella sp. JGM130]